MDDPGPTSLYLSHVWRWLGGYFLFSFPFCFTASAHQACGSCGSTVVLPGSLPPLLSTALRLF